MLQGHGEVWGIELTLQENIYELKEMDVEQIKNLLFVVDKYI